MTRETKEIINKKRISDLIYYNTRVSRSQANHLAVEILKRPVGRPGVSVMINRAKLRKLRREKGLLQRDIAEALGYSDSRITQFETGSGVGGGIPLDALMQIAKILGVDYKELMDTEEQFKV